MKAKAAPKSAKLKLLRDAVAARVEGPAGQARQRRLAFALGQHRHAFLLRLLALYVAYAMGTGQTFAPDAAAIERLAEAAIARLPETFRRHLTNVVLRIEDFADDDVLDAARHRGSVRAYRPLFAAARSASRPAGPRASCRR